MSNVSFEEDQGLPVGMTARPRGFSGMLIKWGIVQSDFQASILLILLTLIVGAFAVYIFMTGQPEPRVITPSEQVELQRMQSAGKNR